MFKILVEDKRKIFHISVEGDIGADTARELVEKLEKEVNTIDTDSYNLVLDIEKMRIKSFATILALANIKNLYNKNKFRQIFSIASNQSFEETVRKLIGNRSDQEIVFIKNINEIG